MNRKSWAYWVLSGSLVTCGGAATQAQEAMPDGPPAPMVMMQAGGMPEDGPGPTGAFGERIELLGFAGMHGGKVVTGAPFSAVAVSESTQTLADGNQIVRKTQTNLYRDSQGRFRREATITAIGPLAASGQPHALVMINDPVAGTNFVLEADRKIAHKMTAGEHPRGGPKGGPGGAAEFRQFKEGAEASIKKESLGTQVINGVTAEGTRFTRTIAAGEIGNAKPITVVSERWYSADLQMEVKSTHSDPRFGESSYTVTNLQRQEPAAALFTVPADYTVQEGGPRMNFRRFQGEAPPPPGN